MFQMLKDMKVHRDDNLFAGLLLDIDDDALVWINIVLFHIETIAKPRSEKISEGDQCLPIK
jgi:hypothetical protein